MFYDYKLMNSNTLGVVWRYAHGQEVVSDNVGIPKICSKIEKLVDYNDTRKKRLSLRSSSLLLNGTVRLYKEELDKLYQDCFKPNSRVTSRSSRDASLADDNNTGSEEHSSKSNNRSKRQSARNRGFISKNKSKKSDTRTKDSTDYESGAMTSITSDQSQVPNQIHTMNKIDAEVQTNRSYLGEIKDRKKYKRKQSFDLNLPMGVIMVYDEFNSPSKIICANINKNVKYL